MPRRTRRTFTATFKAEVLRELLTGQRTPAELCREHQLSPSLLTVWKDTALERLPQLFQEAEQRDPQQVRVAELEQLVGRQALELELLKKRHGCSLAARTETGGRHEPRPAGLRRPPGLSAAGLPALPVVPRRRPTTRRTCARRCSGWRASGPPTATAA